MAGFEQFIKVENGKMETKEKEEIEFTDLYSLIKCDTVELIGFPNNIDLWVDEEGLFKENVITEIKLEGQGSLKIAGIGIFLTHDEDGYSCGLTANQIAYLNRAVTTEIKGVYYVP